MRQEVERAGLIVSMVTADSDVPLNNQHGPDSLRNIGPTLDVAQALGSDLIRVCLKMAADVEHAQRSADLAAEPASAWPTNATRPPSSKRSNPPLPGSNGSIAAISD